MQEAVERDAYVDQVIDETLESYADLPLWARNEIRDFLKVALNTHPVAATLVDRARPRKAPERSGEQRKDGAAPADDKITGGSTG